VSDAKEPELFFLIFKSLIIFKVYFLFVWFMYLNSRVLIKEGMHTWILLL
jgi:hypothetical protein